MNDNYRFYAEHTQLADEDGRAPKTLMFFTELANDYDALLLGRALAQSTHLCNVHVKNMATKQFIFPYG